MKRNRPLDEKVRVAMALMAANDRSQAEIARRFESTQSTVSRVLKQAKVEGLLKHAVAFDAGGVEQEVLDEARKLAARPPELQKHLDALANRNDLPHSVTVRVLSDSDDIASMSDLDARREHVGREAAAYVLDLLRSGVGICGLTWGHSVGAVVAGIEARAKRHGGAPTLVQVVPLCGEPLGKDSASLFSSSALAERLSLAVNRSACHVPPLTMLPAFVPGDFSDAEVDAVWRLVGKIHAYSEVFGGRQVRIALQDGRSRKFTHWAAKLDLILTGISAAGRPLGDGRGPLFDSGSLKEEEFRSMVIGDIGGVLIEREGLSAAQRAKLSRLAARWTGIMAAEMRQCARRAASHASVDTAPPGVVVVAIGQDKSETVIAALKRGLINHLLCDWELERAVLLALK